MNRSTIITGVALLVAVAAGIGIQQTIGRSKGDSTERAGGKGGSKAGAVRKISLSPVEAAKRLRALPSMALPDAPTFDEVEAWAGRLNTKDLVELLDEIGFEDEKGLEGWLRSALFAEWGRRDLQAAIDYLKESAGGAEYAVQQSWSALFRGAAERDPQRALELREQWESLGLGPWAANHAVTAIFRELAREDAAATWEKFFDQDAQLTDDDPVLGFFEGLENAEEVEQFFIKWNRRIWDTEQAVADYAEYERQRSSNLSGAVAIPPAETIAIQAGAAWAKHDLEGAMDWLRNHGPGGERAREWRAVSAMREYAEANPTEALGRLGGKDGFDGDPTLLAAGILAGDPSLGVDLMNRLENHNARVSAFLTAVTVGGNHNVNDFFPGPGQVNRLPAFEERYEQLLDTISAGNFHERQEQALLRHLNQNYRHHVPAAQEAYEASQNR